MKFIWSFVFVYRFLINSNQTKFYLTVCVNSFIILKMLFESTEKKQQKIKQQPENICQQKKKKNIKITPVNHPKKKL